LPLKRGFTVEVAMTQRLAWLVTCGASLMAAASVSAHHSNAAYAVETVHEVTGVVKEWQWVNPHTWLYLTADDGKGGSVEWQLEGRAPGVLLRAGWTKSVLQPGQKVTVHYSPAKDGSKVGIIARVTLAGGAVLGNAPAAVQ
jgi:hypothetical protein